MMKRWRDAIQRNQDIMVGLLFLCLILGAIGIMYMKSAGII